MHKNKASNEAHHQREEKMLGANQEDSRETAVENAAKNVIYAAASKWVGQELNVGDKIPIRTKYAGFGYPSEISISGNEEIEAILSASKEMNTKDLKGHIETLETLLKLAETFRDELAKFDPPTLEMAVASVHNYHSGLEGRILNAFGIGNAAFLSVDALAVGLAGQLIERKQELTDRNLGQGRPPNYPAKRVAEKAGIFYKTVTGQQPTNGEGSNGLSGGFTPFLRDLYDAFGWQETSLRAGLEAAIARSQNFNSTAVRNHLPPFILTDHSR